MSASSGWSIDGWRTLLRAGIDQAGSRLQQVLERSRLADVFRDAPVAPNPAAAGEDAARAGRRGDRLTHLLAGAFGRGVTLGLAVPTVRRPLVRDLSARGGLHLGLRLSAAAFGLALAAALGAFATDIMAGHPAEPVLARAAGSDEALQPAGVGRNDPMMTATAAQQGHWSPIVRPIAIFGLPAPELASLASAYEAYRHTDGGRDDRLSFGEFDPANRKGKAGRAGGHLHLSLVRAEARRGVERAFFVDLARQAGELGLSVERTQQPAALPTKFGPVEVADALLAQSGGARACLAFRHVSERQPFRISGWWCGEGDRPADRRQLACLIDRLDLLSAGEDRALRALFTAAEKARDPECTPSRYAAVGRKPHWLDADSKLPRLRGGQGSAKGPNGQKGG